VAQNLKQAFEYRLAILQAGAGYGKSTALADVAAECPGVLWYQVSEEDNDPLVFLLHLCHAIRQAAPELNDLPIALLDAWDGGQGPLPWRGIVDQIINALSSPGSPALLILDDAHEVTDAGEVPHILERLISRAPASFHVLLAGRPTITLPNLAHWRAKGEVLSLDQRALSFTADEITTLFSAHYHVELTVEEADALLTYTEGWAIALQLVWQNLRHHKPASLELEFPSRWKAASLEALFDLLAREVFAGQSADVREFLLVTSTLRELAPEACDALLRAIGVPAGDAAAMIAYLRRQDLFLVETAEGVMRYHHIFHTFLQQQSPPEQRRDWNRLAADYYLSHGDHEAAIYHLLEAQAWEPVADMLDRYATSLLSAGRLDTLTMYIDSLPPETLHRHPMLIFMLGELARLHSRFDEALGWYRQAETLWRSRRQQDGIARALRGRARVYLDTVDPSKAEQLLEEAIRLSDGYEDREVQVRLFELLAENKLNAGRVEEAERLRQRAEELRLEGPTNDQLWFRVLLRTGRFQEARRHLEALAEAERTEPVQTPRAHRETLLLLSFIYTMQGEAELAYQAAVEGTRRGESLGSPFVSAVGLMRQGHALMLAGRFDERAEHFAKARDQYEKSIEISRRLDVPRLRVESGWGMCRSYGYAGDLTKASSYAQEAIEIAAQAGDEWIASLIRLTMGASLVMAGQYEAAESWLSKASTGFQECSDPFGRSAARLWLSLSYFKRRQFDRLAGTLPEVLATCQVNGYEFLFTGPSMLGPHDERIFVPLLLYAAQKGWEAGCVARVLAVLSLTGVEAHPGYQLRVQTLGRFQVWRGDHIIPANGWRREKSRQLFQLLLTYRHSPLDRDQICEFLWAGTDLQTAQRNFKITLNTLFQVLEPEREPGSESTYILREGSTYGLRPHADLWLDVEEFRRAVKEARGDPDPLEKALALYTGNYLPDMLYETWAAEESERLAALFLENADALAEALVQRKRFNEAIDLCQRILAQDNCWERAYRHLMLAYAGLNDQGQVGRTYRRCVRTLREELEVSPAAETQRLYEQLTSS
jgi:ATP/maltotriose-dependent transcriptional regulator MalT/two-component SAPR family response regulator